MMRLILRLFVPLVLIMVLAGCIGTETAVSPPPTVTPETAVATATPVPPTATPEPTPIPEPTPDPLTIGTAGNPWWNDTVFYQIYVRSFYDSDGDGIGDLNGIIEKLDYLNDGNPATTTDLGITGIWLMPIMEAPKAHPHGYHIVDYYTVEQDYGTNEDFQRLMAEAHARGIRVIIDLVINHTAKEHPWFQAATDPNSDKRDWYIWSEDRPASLGADNRTVWHRDSASGTYYYGVFNGLIPDLNLENPEVIAEIANISEYWLTEMGADGFRMDAIKYLVEEGNQQEDTAATHQWLAAYHSYIKTIDPNAFIVGEAWTANREIARYTGDEVDIAFEFDLAEGILSGVRSRAQRPISQAMNTTMRNFPPLQYATFLANHDQDRTITQVDGLDEKAKLAATVLLTSPGVPFIYYGDEIGMGGSRDTSDAISEANMRRPMQWAGEGLGVGFTTGVPWRAPAEDAATRNVALQTADPESLLSHYRNLIHLRAAHPSLRVGDWVQVASNNAQVYAYLRYTLDEVVLIVVNLSRDPVSAEDYTLELEEGPLAGAVTAVSLLGSATNPTAPDVNSTGGFNGYTPLPELDANSSYIFQLMP